MYNYEEPKLIQQKYIKCEVSHMELWAYQFTVFHCKLYNEFFSTFKNLTFFYR